MDGQTEQLVRLVVPQSVEVPEAERAGVPAPWPPSSQAPKHPGGILHPDETLDSDAIQPPPQGLLHHRVREVAWHIPWYGFKTQARLALDSGISPSTVSRLLRGQELPSLLVALRLTDALSHRLGQALDVGQVFSLDGLYSRSVCDLTGCRSCLPPTAYDRDDNFLAPAPDSPSGQWVKPLSRTGAR